MARLGSVQWERVLGSALVSGSVASVASSVALGLLARAEGKGALQPVNATSHWLNGDEAGTFREADARHTAVGYVTHHAATVFWATLFEALNGRHQPLVARRVVRNAVVTSVVAAAIDYGATPKRFTPGWEFVLSKRAMAGAYGAMAVGLAAGAWMTRADLPRRVRAF